MPQNNNNANSSSVAKRVVILFSLHFYLNSLMSLTLGSSLMVGLLMMFFALLAYLRVDKVSLWLTSAGLMVAIMIVLELPPRESLSSQVRTESRYGINTAGKLSLVMKS